MRGPVRHKPHLLFTWLNDLIRHPRILDAVEDIIGPDILCWGRTFFTKEARNPAMFWHQDSTYWGLEPPDIITAWVAFTDSNAANGAMRVIPATHKMDQVPHRDTFAAGNLLSRGQEIEVEVNERDAAMLELAAGEMSLHHVRLIHGSDPNPSADRRIGFAIRYIPTYVRQVAGSNDSATLVRGKDRSIISNWNSRRTLTCRPKRLRIMQQSPVLRADPDARNGSGNARLMSNV